MSFRQALKLSMASAVEAAAAAEAEAEAAAAVTAEAEAAKKAKGGRRKGQPPEEKVKNPLDKNQAGKDSAAKDRDTAVAEEENVTLVPTSTSTTGTVTLLIS